jgi:hypothetical protein
MAKGLVPGVGGFLREMRELKPSDYRNIAFTLMDGATPLVAGEGAGDSYTVPTTHKLLITEIRGMYELRDLGNEAVVGAPNTDIAVLIEDKMLARLLRTTVKLWSKDRSENLTEEKNIGLASICPQAGGAPLDFSNQPQILQPGETISAQVRYFGGGANFLLAGNGTIPYDVGVTISGILIPKAALPDRAGESILYRFLQEMQSLSAFDYRKVVVTLEKNPTLVDANAEVTWRVPGTHNLLIQGIAGHCTFDKFESEIDDPGGLPLSGNASARQRLIGRTSRVMARLSVTDHGQDINIIQGNAAHTRTNGGGVTIGSIYPPARGKVIDWSDHPFIVPANETLKMELAWNGTQVPFITGDDYVNNSRFGLSMIGTLVRVKNS